MSHPNHPHSLLLRLNDADHEALERAAAARNLPRTELLRQLVRKEDQKITKSRRRR